MEGSQTFSVPSSPVEASLEPSALNATSVTSPSCPWNERMLSPVSPSLMSMMPESLGALGHEDSRGAPGEVPPTPGTSSSSRDATTARWSASSASWRTVPSDERVRLDGLAREQDAEFRVDLEVRHRGGGELPRRRDPGLALRPVALARCDDGERSGDEGRGREDGNEAPKPARRSPFDPPLVLAAPLLLSRSRSR